MLCAGHYPGLNARPTALCGIQSFYPFGHIGGQLELHLAIIMLPVSDAAPMSLNVKAASLDLSRDVSRDPSRDAAAAAGVPLLHSNAMTDARLLLHCNDRAMMNHLQHPSAPLPHPDEAGMRRLGGHHHGSPSHHGAGLRRLLTDADVLRTHNGWLLEEPGYPHQIRTEHSYQMEGGGALCMHMEEVHKQPIPYLSNRLAEDAYLREQNEVRRYF